MELAKTPGDRERFWSNPDAPVVDGVHPQAQMWSELRRLVKIGEDLELADKLPPRPSHFMTLVNGVRDEHPPVPEHGWRGLRMREAKLACAAMQYLAGVAEQEDTSQLADDIWKGATQIDSTAPVLESATVVPELADEPDMRPGTRNGMKGSEGRVSEDGSLTMRCPAEASAGMLLKVVVRNGTKDGQVMSVVVPKHAKPGELFTLTEKERKRATKAYHQDMKHVLRNHTKDAPSRTIDRWDPLAAASGKGGGQVQSKSTGPVAPELSSGWDGLDPFRTLASLDREERLERMKESGEVLVDATVSSGDQTKEATQLTEAQMEAKRRKKKKKRDRQKLRKAELAPVAAAPEGNSYEGTAAAATEGATIEDPVMEEDTPPSSLAPEPMPASASDYLVPDD